MNNQTEAVAELRTWLVEQGVDDLHSWRCGHPDIYGQCSCVDELAADLLAHIRAFGGNL